MLEVQRQSFTRLSDGVLDTPDADRVMDNDIRQRKHTRSILSHVRRFQPDWSRLKESVRVPTNKFDQSEWYFDVRVKTPQLGDSSSRRQATAVDEQHERAAEVVGALPSNHLKTWQIAALQ